MNILTAKLLSNAGYENVFVVDPPETIDDYILISSSGGFGLSTEDAGFGRPTIQIIVANKSYVSLKTTTKNIIDTLIRVTETDIRDLIAELSDWDDWSQWINFDEWEAYVDKLTRELYQDKIKGYDLLSDELELGRDEQLRYRASINFVVFYNYT